MTHLKETPHSKTALPIKKPSTTPDPSKPPAAPPKPSCFHDLDFWRFVLAALSLAWEAAKTWVR